MNRALICAALAGVFVGGDAVMATVNPGHSVARFETVLGPIHIEVYDDDTPLTAANFKTLIEQGAYDNMFFHRSARLLDGTPFVVQGGGFNLADPELGPIGNVPNNGPVLNEPFFSNTRGTVAMAKLGGDPNSATNQFFFNVGNNGENLDFQNGGFTVFGNVLGDDMDIVDDIADLLRVNAGSPFNELPVLNPPVNGTILFTDLVLVTRAIVVVPGDANFDGVVDLIDLSTLATNFGATDVVGAEFGDFNFDRVVDLIDLSTLATNFGAGSSVPEPGAAAGLLGLAVMLRRRAG
ncbi:peptidylprolyl isomerase [Mucisphaera sp.]|uniref:peptidylprolyl isomerase n=1 Tax=Mucisphaera sp. TaxID=2913024 RepID=UPI003D0ADE95